MPESRLLPGRVLRDTTVESHPDRAFLPMLILALHEFLVHGLARLILIVHRISMVTASWLASGCGVDRPHSRSPSGCAILLTGTFHADNWLLAHLKPLAASETCTRIWVVSNSVLPEVPKMVGVYPPTWLKSIIGAVPARLMVFAWMAVRHRPDIVGGFHLLMNGLAALVVARLVRSRSLYFCVGGPTELLDGGIYGDTAVFSRMTTVDRTVESRLIQTVGCFDIVVTMGTRAVDFFRSRGATNSFYVVPGGVDAQRFVATGEPASYHMILVGRLARIKRVDVFLHTVKLITHVMPQVRALIVGDGDLRTPLEELSRQLDLQANVMFCGHQQNVEAWLRRACLLVLTSYSEGLPLAVMEAMTSGLPVVSSDVGDVADLVQDGVNGYLVPSLSPQLFANRIWDLLSDAERRRSFARAARRAASRVELRAVSKQWDVILNRSLALNKRHSQPSVEACAALHESMVSKSK